MKEVTMPKLAMTQETGTILQWYKSEGELVESGEPLLEVMTNKINIDVEAYDQGTLLKRLYEVGAEVPVLDVIAYIGSLDEKVPEAGGVNSNDHEASSGSERQNGTQAATNHVRATPAARALARELGVSLSEMRGTGNGGRIHREDVEAMSQKRVATGHLAPSSRRQSIVSTNPQTTKASQNCLSTPELSEPSESVVRIRGPRKIIGQRMAQSAFSAPHVTLTREIDMGAAMELRKKVMPTIERETGIRVSVNTLVLKAVAAVLPRYPKVNATWRKEDEMVQHSSVHLGMAVAGPHGLLVPVIRFANAMGLSELSRTAADLAKGAREQTLHPDTLENGTFTVSNLGMYGVETFTPIINAPQVAILGVGCVTDKPAVIESRIDIRPMMMMSLSFDHRALDGAEAAEFLRSLAECLMDPLLLLL